jgi:hypothetical protein
VTEFLALIAATAGKPARTLVLTSVEKADLPIVRSLLEHGITRVLASPATRATLFDSPGAADPSAIRALAGLTPIGDGAVPVDFLPLDQVRGTGSAAVHLPGPSVLFAGPLVVNGPRASLTDFDTALWVAALRRLQSLRPAQVVPAFGSWGGPELLTRQHRFLSELRRQVGYHVAQGRPRVDLGASVQLPADDLVRMPYDEPSAADLEHVFRELTVPMGPFHGRAPAASDRRPHALVLIGDGPHEPGHIEEGLQPVFDATGVVPHFTPDVHALSAANLAKVQLLVILRDGLQRPQRDARTHFMWMTREQAQAVAAFVQGGGGFLCSAMRFAGASDWTTPRPRARMHLCLEDADTTQRARACPL